MAIINLIYSMASGQEGGSIHFIDSLKHQLAITKSDTDRVLVIAELCDQFQNNDFPSLQVYSRKGIALAQKIKFSRGEIKILCYLANGLLLQGDLPKSLDLLFEALRISETEHLTAQTVLCLTYIGNAYSFVDDCSKSITYLKRADQLNKGLARSTETTNSNTNLNLGISYCYLTLNRLDSSKNYLSNLSRQVLENDYVHSNYLLLYGNLLYKLGNRETSYAYLKQSIRLNDKNKYYSINGDACYFLAEQFKQNSQRDSCIFYAKKGLDCGKAINYKLVISENSKLLAEQYEYIDIGRAYHYLKMVTAINEELFGSKKAKEMQNTLSEEQERQRRREAERIEYQTRLKEYAFVAGLGIMLLIAFILYRNNLREKKDKNLLKEKSEVIEKTLVNLRSTQTQLIQREKMASLGELTAGIAHEIQNPLNFVNNFSEVNKEMLEELKAECLKPKAERDDQLEVELINDLIGNEEKINHHGKRADSIVKGMLEHSRAGTGDKQLTNLNALADEFLKLSYHGFRSKDKLFNSELVTHFDEKLPEINVIARDIGRVMLNLFNNAFYAVNQKAKNAGADYKPKVSVTTSLENGQAVIKVKDNGIGISDAIKEKIMQPFFTTKPTGDGTGLGLSLTYDMVVKGHGGSIQVDSDEDESSEFIISLPIN